LGGESENDTATQEKIADYGNQLRTATMQDQVNEFIKNQGRRLLQDLKQFATAPLMLKITGLNELDPVSGKRMSEEWAEFGTENNPKDFKEYIQGDYDVDIDVTNIARRDIGLIRRQMIEVIDSLKSTGLLDMMLQRGVDFDAEEYVKDLLENFETLKNTDKYFRKLPPMPPEGMIPPGVMPPGAGIPPGAIPPEGGLPRAVPGETVPPPGGAEIDTMGGA